MKSVKSLHKTIQVTEHCSLLEQWVVWDQDPRSKDNGLPTTWMSYLKKIRQLFAKHWEILTSSLNKQSGWMFVYLLAQNVGHSVGMPALRPQQHFYCSKNSQRFGGQKWTYLCYCSLEAVVSKHFHLASHWYTFAWIYEYCRPTQGCTRWLQSRIQQ